MGAKAAECSAGVERCYAKNVARSPTTLVGPGGPRAMDPQPNSQLPATEITALLGRGTHFEGKLHFEGRVRIDGFFKGEIRSDDTLVIGEGAEVHAAIDVATVIVRGGIVHGNIRSRVAIEVHSPGKIVGNLHSPSVFIDRGGEF